MKTTKKHFEEFKAEFRRWQEYFGLMDWDIQFAWKKLDECDAEISWDINAKSACVRLNKECVLNEVKISAFHEAVELWLVPLRYISRARFIDHDTMAQEFHAIVRFMENRFYPVIKNRGK